MSKAMTLRLPDEAHEMLRTKAFNERRSITSLVLDAITEAWGKPARLCDNSTCWNTPTTVSTPGGFHWCDEHAPVTQERDLCGWSPAPGFYCIQPEGHGGVGHMVADHPHDPGSEGRES